MASYQDTRRRGEKTPQRRETENALRPLATQHGLGGSVRISGGIHGNARLRP